MPNSSTHAALARQEPNFFRDILEVARIYQTEMMHLLSQEKGHHQLRLSFRPVMTSIPSGGIRITDLATALGMSKQNCFQLLKQVEAAGYIARKDDPQDKRARHITLTRRGIQLLRDAIEITNRTNGECIAILGGSVFESLAKALADACRGLNLQPLARVDAYVSEGSQPSTFSRDLILLANHCNKTLMDSTVHRGHPSLRPSYGQVLMHIGEEGGRIQDIARINDISKQAVGQLVGEIEQLGYIRRAPDLADGRSKILYFTAAGRGLLRDSLQAADSLLTGYQKLIGPKRLTQMQASLGALYRGMQPQQPQTQRHHVAMVDQSEHSSACLEQVEMLFYLLYCLDKEKPAGVRLLDYGDGSQNEGRNIRLRRALLRRLEEETADPLEIEAKIERVLSPRKLGMLRQLVGEAGSKIRTVE